MILKGRTVAVTGGTHEPGRGIAWNCLREGANVVLLAFHPQEAADLRQTFGPEIPVCQIDPTDIGTGFLTAGLDGLVVAHGLSDDWAGLIETPALFDEVFHANILSVLQLVHGFAEKLENGAVVLTSPASQIYEDGDTLPSSPTGVVAGAMFEQLAQHYSGRFRINRVTTSFVSQSHRDAAPRPEPMKDLTGTLDADLDDFRRRMVPFELPLNEQHAPIYTFLISPVSGDISGQTFTVDRGMFNRAVPRPRMAG